MAGEMIKEYYMLQDGTKVPKLGFGCYNPGKLDFVEVSLRFLIQKGVMPIPKSGSKEHMLDNMRIFDFEISEEDMWMLTCMPQETWQGEHPDFAVPKMKSNFAQ